MFRLLPALGLACSLAGADYDLLIRNARVIDGTGNPWFRADAGIREGRIAALGRLTGATASRVVEAGDRVLAPGFIDVHTHLEKSIPIPLNGAIEDRPGGDNYLMDGVTTVVTGNCGFSETNLAEFFSRLETKRIGLNLASLVGHNDLRSAVLGTANRQATAEEIARMQALVERAMQEGAVGLATGLIYVPGTYANTEEVLALAKTAAKQGGIYASHIRDEGERALEAIEEAVRVGRQAGARIQISHFKISNKRLWGMSEKTVELVEQFRREGVDVVVDQYPYDRSSTTIGYLAPSWALADGKAKIRERLNDPATRARIAREMRQRNKQLGFADYSFAVVAFCPFDRSLEGRSISEINRLKKRSAGIEEEIQTILDLLAQGDVSMVYQVMSEVDIERILRYPNTAIASDGWMPEFGAGVPHPRCYGTNARVLAEFVRRRRVITLEDAVRRMTSLPARTFSFRDRGLVREGYAADLVLFDPARVEDKATFSAPHQFSEGFDLVLVNGTPVVDDGRLTGARPGRILRHRPQ